MIQRNEEASTGQALVGAFSFALLAGLAVLSLLIVVMGAKVYRTIDNDSMLNNQSRTVLCYIAGKVRATDAADMIALSTVDGRDALVLGEELSGVRYNNYIYFMDGGIYECFTRADRAPETALSDRIVDAAGLSFALSRNLLTVTVTDAAGESRTLSLCLQSANGEAIA